MREDSSPLSAQHGHAQLRPGTNARLVDFKSRPGRHMRFDMSQKDHIDRVWDIIEKVGVCMLTTQFAGGLRARPLEARPDRDAGLIFFVTDIHSTKEDEIEATRGVRGGDARLIHRLPPTRWPRMAGATPPARSGRAPMQLQRPSPPSSRVPTRQAHPKPPSSCPAGVPRCLRWACLHPSARST
jgi:hypothetical protein